MPVLRLISLNIHLTFVTTLWNRYIEHSYFSGKENKVQEGSVTCPEKQQKVVKSGFQLRRAGSSVEVSVQSLRHAQGLRARPLYSPGPHGPLGPSGLSLWHVILPASLRLDLSSGADFCLQHWESLFRRAGLGLWCALWRLARFCTGGYYLPTRWEGDYGKWGRRYVK